MKRKPAAKPKTRVRFLWDDRTQSVLAYFPTLFHRHDYEESLHLCYSHVGQHGPCSPWFARLLRPATRREYAGLYAELQSIGYLLKPERIKPYPQCHHGWSLA